MKRTFAKVLSLIAITLLSSGCKDQIDSTQEEPHSAPEGRIAFTRFPLATSDSTFPPEVLVCDSLGRDQRHLAYGFTWGTGIGRILYSSFARDSKDSFSVYETCNDALIPQSIVGASAPGHSIASMSISPSGRLIAYVLRTFSHGTITQPDSTILCIGGVDSLEASRITDHAVSQTPVFSWDNSELAYFARDPLTDAMTLNVMSVDGSRFNAITPVSALPADAVRLISWNSQTKQIAYVDSGSVMLVEHDGSNRHAIAAGNEAAWSPDGKILAIVSPDGEILLTQDGGTTFTNVTNTNAQTERWIDWSPDSRRILCTAYEGHSWDNGSMPLNTFLKEIDARTGSARTLAQTASLGYYLK